jgi:hypothetical protein
MVFGKSSSKMRGWISAEIWLAINRFRISVLFCSEYGVSRSEASPASAAPSTANASTGAITRRLETPAARMAVISPSLDIRPSPIRMPTSTPNGMVSGSTGGKVRANRLKIVLGSGLLPTRTSNSRSIF